MKNNNMNRKYIKIPSFSLNLYYFFIFHNFLFCKISRLTPPTQKRTFLMTMMKKMKLGLRTLDFVVLAWMMMPMVLGLRMDRALLIYWIRY